MDGPFGLLAELTYDCPLHCAYCSNPLDLGGYRDELRLPEWERVIAEAAQLGVLQLHLSGGEPLRRRDVVDLVRTGNRHGMYTNLVTSAIGLNERRALQLRDAGLDHVQISFQAEAPGLADRIAGTPSHARKLDAARLVKRTGWPLTVNVVLHRRNLDHIAEIIELAEAMEADRLELANTQYYGWAWRNRAALLPSREQLDRAEEAVAAARARLGGRMDILYILPDYYENLPKPCMGGWAARQLVVAPDGTALPCLAAHDLPLPAANVRDHSLRWIWEESPLFTRFRGTDWMPDPCRACERRELDFGGCRCQAFQLTGDASVTDPVCELAPDHDLVVSAVRAANDRPAGADDPPLVARPHPRQTG